MRIDLKDAVQLYKGMVSRPEIKNDKQKIQDVNLQKFDQIEIRSSNVVKEKRFFEQMVQKVQQGVIEDKKDERIGKLKEQIENGQYRFDVTELVSKILIEKGE